MLYNGMYAERAAMLKMKETSKDVLKGCLRPSVMGKK